MALEKALEVYLNNGESSEVIETLKQLGVCLAEFFNQVQFVKAGLNSKIYLKDIHKAIGNAAFDQSGELQVNQEGSNVKLIYTYFDSIGRENTGFILITTSHV